MSRRRDVDKRQLTESERKRWVEMVAINFARGYSFKLSAICFNYTRRLWSNCHLAKA